MKKFYKYIVLMLLLAIGFFYGCSKSADMQTTPKNLESNTNVLDVNYFANNDENGKDKLLAIRFEETDRLTPIKAILMVLEKNTFQTVSKQAKRILINKLEAVVLMYNKHNIKGAVEKLDRDLFPKILYVFVNENVGLAVKEFLGFQKILIEHPEISSDTNFVIAPTFQVWKIIITLIGIAISAYNIIHSDHKTKCFDGQNHAGKHGDTFMYSNGNLCAEFSSCSCYITPTCRIEIQ